MLSSLDAVRLDRRMTLFQPGEQLEPTTRPVAEVDATQPFLIEHPSHGELLAEIARQRGEASPTPRLLPEFSRTTDRFGIVTEDHAILRKSTVDVPGDRENLSDVTFGEPVWIMDRNAAGDSLLIHAGDGYLGWVDADAIWPVDAETFRVQVIDFARADFDSGSPGHNALLREAVRRRDRDALAQRKPSATRSSGEKIASILREAQTFVGTRYVWGGKTIDGIDCSGLVQTAFGRHGVALPRDADQQSLVGQFVATRWNLDPLIPGDLLFYVSPRRGNVHHVAIYLGDGEYIEAAGSDVHIRSMVPGASNYDAKRAATFGWARRVIR